MNSALAPLTMAQLHSAVGSEIGVSSWITLDQARINAFADCTGDQQWIHVDPERAARDAPFGGAIAHGFLTLSILAPAVFELLIGRLTLKQAVNYGLDKVRFLSPVRSGKRVRVRLALESLEEKKPGLFMATCPVTIEIEDEAKPALAALSQFMMYV